MFTAEKTKEGKKIRTKVFSSFLVLMLGSMLVWSCTSSEEHISNNEERSLDNPINLALHKGNDLTVNPFNLSLPGGTVFQQNLNQITFTLPEGYTLLGINSGGVSRIANGSGTITCDCKNGTGCNPFVAGDKVGCELDKYSECTATKSAQSIKYDEFYVLDHTSNGEDFATINDVIGKRLMPVGLLDYKPISDAIDELMAFHSESKHPLKVRVANIFGLAVIMELPLDPNYSGPLLRINDDGGSITCSCLSDGSCPAKSAKLGAIKYCDVSKCSRSLISFGIIHGHHEAVAYVDENGYIR